jgi:hypothetical protein
VLQTVVSLLRRGWVRLHEKGGKELKAPYVPTLETFLDEYIAAAGIAGDTDGDGPLFRYKPNNISILNAAFSAYSLDFRPALRNHDFVPGALVAIYVFVDPDCQSGL